VQLIGKYETDARREPLFCCILLKTPSSEIAKIFAMRANGTDVRQLIDNKWDDATAAWAPEPKPALRTLPRR
jgi:hypothetical protein